MGPMAETLPTIGDRLRFAFDLYTPRAALSFRDLDRICDPPLNYGHSAQIARGTIADPGTDTVRRLATALGCSFSWLATGEGGKDGRPKKEAVKAGVEAAWAKWHKAILASGTTRVLGVTGEAPRAEKKEKRAR